MIRDMTKLRIIGPKTRMPDIISDLHKLKVMHIIEGQSDEANQGKPMMEAEQLSVSLIKLRAVISQLKIKPSEEHKPEKLAKIIKTVDFIAKTLKAANESLKSADEIEKKGNTIIAHLNVLKALDIKEKTEFETIDVFVGYIKDAVKFKESLLKKTDRFLLKTVNGAISLFIDKRFSDDAGHILSSNQFSQIPLTFEDRNEVLQAISKAKTDRKEALIKIDLIRKTYADILPSYERMLSQELTKAEAPLKFIETDEAFLIWGFAPKARAQSMIQSLMHRAHNNLFIEEREIEKYDQIPVSLDNPRKVKDFESLLSLYSLPKYKEIDPSWFLFLTFPLLFGFMLGDMGYGITTAILFYILKKKMPNAGGFFNVLILSSFASIFFGIVFGEFFGLELYHPLLNRNPEHGLEPLMITAIAVGVLHINAGLIAGFINEFRAHGLKAAIFEKFSWIVLEISVAVLALSYTQILSKVWGLTAGYLLLAMAVFMLYKGEGVKGIVELPSIFGNILSYVRLMAIGVASVGLALVVNEFAVGFFQKGGLFIAAGVLILVVGHIINIGLGLLGCFLHTLRLHYVELFSKFYKGGGVAFKPFGEQN